MACKQSSGNLNFNFGLVSCRIKLCGLFDAETILLEEQK